MCRSSPSRLERLEERQGTSERPAADLVERERAELDGGGVVAEPAPHARGARDVVDHPLELVAVQERDPRRPPRSPGRAPCTGTRTPAGRSPAGTVNQASPAPWRIVRRCRPSSSSNGVSRSKPRARAIASIIRANIGLASKSGQTTTAPCAEAPMAVGDRAPRGWPLAGSRALRRPGTSRAGC